MISPAAPAMSSVVALVGPPTFRVEFGDVMVSPAEGQLVMHDGEEVLMQYSFARSPEVPGVPA
jgi:hypothetical protein